MATSSSNYVSFASINDDVMVNAQDIDTHLRQLMDGLGSNPSTYDMLKMQQETQRWSMMVELQSQLTKTCADTMKSIIQKSG
jgi:hypothetical protein